MLSAFKLFGVSRGGRAARMLGSAVALVAACAGATSAAAIWAPVSLAAGPTTVTVRIEGLDGNTLLAQTPVTTNAAPIAVEGGTCSGTSAGGALYDAVHGNWRARSASEGVEIDGIDGVDFPDFAEHGDAYWSFWVNNQFATQGACSEQLVQGERIVFAAQCIALGPDCPTSATAPDHFLTLTEPPASVNVGESVSLTIGSLSTVSGAGESTLPAGITLVGAPVSAAPSAQGAVTVRFSSPGTYTLQARGPDAVPSDPFVVCVHNGNDGNCGTIASSSQPPAAVPGASAGSHPAAAPYTGPYAVVARILDLVEHRVYPRRDAPRLLSGFVSAHVAVASISIALRRSYRERCFAYSGERERFMRAPCGTARPFELSSASPFSYLLPAPLPPGRYVFDIQATDALGNHTALARGTSRIVFYVR